MSYEDLQKERDSLLAQEIGATQEELFLHVWSALNMKLLILRLNVQMLLMLRILLISLLSLIPHPRTMQVSLMMQG